jgi:hypothetical protein
MNQDNQKIIAELEEFLKKYEHIPFTVAHAIRYGNLESFKGELIQIQNNPGLSAAISSLNYASLEAMTKIEFKKPKFTSNKWLEIKTVKRKLKFSTDYSITSKNVDYFSKAVKSLTPEMVEEIKNFKLTGITDDMFKRVLATDIGLGLISTIQRFVLGLVLISKGNLWRWENDKDGTFTVSTASNILEFTDAHLESLVAIGGFLNVDLKSGQLYHISEIIHSLTGRGGYFENISRIFFDSLIRGTSYDQYDQLSAGLNKMRIGNLRKSNDIQGTMGVWQFFHNKRSYNQIFLMFTLGNSVSIGKGPITVRWGIRGYIRVGTKVPKLQFVGKELKIDPQNSMPIDKVLEYIEKGGAFMYDRRTIRLGQSIDNKFTVDNKNKLIIPVAAWSSGLQKRVFMYDDDNLKKVDTALSGNKDLNFKPSRLSNINPVVQGLEITEGKLSTN